VCARDAGVKRFVYAASSSTYGDHPGLPKIEDRSAAAVAVCGHKYLDELYADVFDQCYGTSTIGLVISTYSDRARTPKAPTLP
jgi:UDP-N-acetylglucosamine 4-epimerase